MHRDRDGPSRITTRRSCDIALSHVVIRTTMLVRLADHLGCQGNDTRSPRLASADKYLAIPKYRGEISCKTISDRLNDRGKLHAIPRYSSRSNEDSPIISTARSKREERSGRSRCNETFARTIYLEKFFYSRNCI